MHVNADVAPINFLLVMLSTPSILVDLKKRLLNCVLSSAALRDECSGQLQLVEGTTSFYKT